MEFVFEQQVLFRVEMSLTCDLMVEYPWGGERGQNLECLRFFFTFAFNFIECNCQF